MTRTFVYKFTTYKTVDGELLIQDHRLKLAVTDKMEERDYWKRAYATSRFNEILKSQYGYKKSVVMGCDVEEVK